MALKLDRAVNGCSSVEVTSLVGVEYGVFKLGSTGIAWLSSKLLIDK